MDSQVKSEPVDGVMIRGAGDVQGNAEVGNERVTGEKIVTNLPRFFQKITWK